MKYCLKKDTKDWWIQELVLWKDKQDWQTFNQTHQEKQREDPKYKTRNERGEITTDSKETQRIIRTLKKYKGL